MLCFVCVKYFFKKILDKAKCFGLYSHCIQKERKMFQSKKIKSARRKIKLSLGNVAYEMTKLGYEVTPQTVWNWERAKTTPDAQGLALLSFVLQRPISYFFDLKTKQSALVNTNNRLSHNR